MAANPKPLRQWIARTRRLGRQRRPRHAVGCELLPQDTVGREDVDVFLAELEAATPGKRLGCVVQVIAPLPVWSSAGGWLEGELTLPVGATIRLIRLHDHRVFFEPAYPGQEGGGDFPASDLGRVRRLDGGPLPDAPAPISSAARAALDAFGARFGHAELLEDSPSQVVLQVQAKDILQDIGGGAAGARPGLPAWALGVAVRYRVEGWLGSCGTHGPHPEALPPGSPEARRLGCCCPAMDNEDAAEVGQRVYVSQCPVHRPVWDRLHGRRPRLRLEDAQGLQGVPLVPHPGLEALLTTDHPPKLHAPGKSKPETSD